MVCVSKSRYLDYNLENVCFVSEETQLRIRAGKPALLGRENLSYLKGLVHGGTPDVQLLIDAIEEHDQIELWLAY